MVLSPKIINGISEIDCASLAQVLTQENGAANVKLIDVRRPEEFNSELGHVKGAELFTLGPQLATHLADLDKNQEIVFICRSGARSGSVTFECTRMGFTNVMNLTGGMMAWNHLGFPVQRD